MTERRFVEIVEVIFFAADRKDSFCVAPLALTAM
jgi:hypothetical protein